MSSSVPGTGNPIPTLSAPELNEMFFGGNSRLSCIDMEISKLSPSIISNISQALKGGGSKPNVIRLLSEDSTHVLTDILLECSKNNLESGRYSPPPGPAPDRISSKK